MNARTSGSGVPLGGGGESAPPRARDEPPAGGRAVRKATAADIPLLIPALARSFASQPLTKWILGEGERALRKGERVLELDFRSALRYDLMFTTADLRGAALWHPPERRETLPSNVAWLAKLLLIAGISRDLPAQLAAFRRFERLFPRIPNYYLSLLAVAPDSQGRGIGSALLRPVLAMCDAERVAAYTVTDTEANVRFYEKHGFRVRDAIRIPRRGLVAWTMLREPE